MRFGAHHSFARRTVRLVVCLICCATFVDLQTASAQRSSAPSPAPQAVSAEKKTDAAGTIAAVTMATYRGRIHGREITSGELALEVDRLGRSPGRLDWTDVSIAMQDLQWEGQPLLSGTSAEQRMLIYTDRDQDRLSGHWSACGQSISGKSVFDLNFPQALNTRLILQLPPALMMEASQGVLLPPKESGEGVLQEWTLELGNQSSTTLKVGPAQQFRRVISPRYEIETEHRTRRDGIFLKADLTVDGPWPLGESLQIRLDNSVEVQSVTMFSGTSQASASLAFQRDKKRPGVLVLSSPSLHQESRFTLRIRGFQAVSWGVPHVMPKLQLRNAQETRRSIVVRVEPPLQLQSIDPQGVIQTGLTSEETAGEVWKFEAREAGARLSTLIALPRSEIVAELSCLADMRRPHGWVASVLSMHVENGTRFNASIHLPDDWKLVSLAAGNAESRLAAWELDEQTLHVTWQNPMTATSHRQLQLFVRAPGWEQQTPFPLPLPHIHNANNVSITYQTLLPTGLELQVVEGDGWRVSDSNEILPALVRLREVTERISNPQSMLCTNLRSAGEVRHGRTLVSLVPRNPMTEILTSSESLESSQPLLESVAIEKTPQVKDEAPAIPSLPALAMQVLSMAGPSQQNQCVHHAQLQFDRSVPIDQLNLQLPAECRVSAVAINNHSVTVFRKGDQIPLPKDVGTISKLQLTYITSPQRHWLSLTNRVPLPQTGIPVTSFHWTLDLPHEQRLSRVSLPQVLKESEHDRDLVRQFFGPLSRQSAERMFNPLNRKDWFQLLHSAGQTSGSDAPRRALQFIAPTIGTSVQFITWNSSLTRSYAWVALLGCLMVGAAARLFRIGWLQKFSIIWLILLLAAASMAPAAWTLIFGGMFAGSLLSMLIPRRWMQKRDFLAKPSTARKPSQELATVTGVLLLIGSSSILPWSAANAQSAVQENAGLPQATLPPYLIHSARYELLESSPSPRFRAVYEVLAQSTADGLLVRLPLQDVVFSTAAECLVNGQPQPLIPSVTGDAMVVRLQPGNENPGSGAALPAEWSRQTIQVEFAIRAQKEVGNPASPSPIGNEQVGDMDPSLGIFQATIPTVLESQLSLPSKWAKNEFRRAGGVERQQKESIVQLGGIGKLASLDQPLSTGDDPTPSAVTVLDVSPLRIKGQTRLMAGASGWPGQLPLRFPAGCVISSVTGSSVIDSVEAIPTQVATEITLRLRPGSPAPPVTVNFEMAENQLSTMELTIPPFPLWGGPKVQHTIGMTGPPTSTLTLIKGTGITALAAEDWPAQSDLGRSRPAVAVALKSPQPLTLTWNRLTPLTTATLTETLMTGRDEIEWSARIRVGVSQVPAFLHQFRLDPALRIQSVTEVEQGRNAVRYTRNDDILSLFLPGGQLGERSFIITGQMPLAVDAWSNIPNFEMLEATTTEELLTIQDQSGWNIELEASPGVPIPISQKTESRSADQTVRNVGTFRRDATVRPERLRVAMPPRATRADSVVLLKTSNPQHWEIATTIHLSAVESGMRKAIFRVPAVFQDFRIRPSHFQHSEVVDANGTTVTVRIPERFSSSATLTIVAELAPELRSELLAETGLERPRQSIPQIEVLSAQRASQFVLIDPHSPLVPAPTGSLQIDAGSFPAWAPADWKRAIQHHQLHCYQQIRRDLTLVHRSAAETTGQSLVRLDESVIWPLGDGKFCGLTRIWLATQEAETFLVAHSTDMKIDHILSVDQGAVSWKPVADGTQIALPRGESLVGLILHWTRKDAGNFIRLPDYGVDLPGRRLVAVIQPDNWSLEPGTAAPVKLLETWLVRWSALLQCLNDLSGPVAVDSHLLSNIRLCQKEASALIARASPNADEKQMAEYQRLNTLWNELKAELVISSAPNPIPPDPFANTFTELLEQRNPGLRVKWLIPSARTWTGRLEAGGSGSFPWRAIFGSLLALVGIGFVWKLSGQLFQLREIIARHPAWSFMALGLIWWIWLAPSAIGLLIIFLAWSWSGVHWLISRIPSRAGESTVQTG